MEDQKGEAAIDARQDHELDLSLGLRPAPSRCNLQLLNPKNPADNPAAAAPEDSSDFSPNIPIWGKGGTRSEQQTKTEAQALRRQEARKKRDEKRKSKANSLNGNSNEMMFWSEKRRALVREREIEGDFGERRRKGATCDGNEVEGAPSPTTSFYRPGEGFDGNQLNALPYSMMPGLVGSDANGFQQVLGAGGAGGFRPYQAVEKNSVHESSPCVSDYQTTSGQGASSSDGGSHSSHSHPDLTIKNCSTTSNNNTQIQTSNHHSQSSAPHPNSIINKAECNSSSYQTEASQTLRRVDLRRPPKPQTHKGSEFTLLSHMPCVATSGNGPNGKRITGFLYKYTKLEVSIVCVCHGTSFSPAGFVEHAGGVDIENPLRHITVSPFRPPSFNL